jgi:hypothetical protein
MTRSLLTALLALLFSLQSLKAQPEVKIYNVVASPGEILVQLDLLGFTGSNSFATLTFEVDFDDDLLVFTGITNMAVPGHWNNNSPAGGTSPLVISYFSFGGAQSLNGKLLDIRFNYFGGFSSGIDFAVNYCEVSTQTEPIPNIIYTNGSVTQSAAVGSVSMANLQSPTGTVMMPVSMGGAGFNNVTQAKFRIAYDTGKLTYQSIQNSILPGYTASASNGILTFEWTGTAQNFSASTQVFEIAFTFNGTGNAVMEFLPGSFVKSGSDFLAIDYFNGLIESLIRFWTGAVNSDWHNSANWAGDVPGSTDEVVIAPTANDPQINTFAEAADLLIEAGASLTVSPSGSLSVYGDFVNNAGSNKLLIRSNETGTGSLIYNSGNIAARVERFIGNEYGVWKQISSPVAAENIEQDFGEGSFFSWFEPAQSWVSLSNNFVWPTWNDVNNGHKNFIPGKGYLAAHPNSLIPENRNVVNLIIGAGTTLSYIADQTITVAGDGNPVQVMENGGLRLKASQSIHLLQGFSVQAGGDFQASIDPAGNFYTKPEFAGTLNHGPVEFTLQKQAHPDDPHPGFNLAGNPYPSSIDWKAPDGWSGRNNLQTEGGGYTIWIWNSSIGNYGTYNSASLLDEGTNNASRYIAPMQGFWVKAENHLGVLGMNDNVRTHSNQEWLKSTPALADVLRLKVTGTANNYSDETIIEFGHNSDDGGASKMLSIVTEAPALYSLVKGNAYAIGFLNDISGHPYVNLGFKAGAEAVYTLALANADFFHDIIIEDLRDGRKQKLAIDMPYHFSAKTSDDSNRFVLHFKALGTDPLDMLPSVNAWAYERLLYICNPLDEGVVVEIFSMAGKLLYTHELSSQGLHRLPLQLPPGIYLLRLHPENYRDSATGTSIKLTVF